MHFSSVAAFIAISSFSITHAAPVANVQDDLNRRQITYQIVNVDGEPGSSVAPDIETVTETLKSTVTAPGSPAVDQTVTVTATPSRTPSSPAGSSSTPASHLAPPPGGSFMPSNSNGFFRRGLNAAGNPGEFARNYLSSSAAWPTSTPSLAARNYESSSYTPSSTFSVPTLAARNYEGSSYTPSASVATPSLAARQYGRWSSSVQFSSTPTVAPTPTATPLVAREWAPSSSVATPSGTSSVSPSAYAYARDYAAAASGSSSGFVSGTPSSSASIIASPTPALGKRGPGHYSSSSVVSIPYSSSAVPTPSSPSSPFSYARVEALLY